MLRLRFTPVDLASVRLAGGLDPMWEAALGAQALQAQRPLQEVRSWQRSARQRLTSTMRPLLELVPSSGGFPDFLTPAPYCDSVEDGVAMLLDTPTVQIRRELADLFPQRSAWQTRLALGSARARRQLGDAVREFHRLVLRPVAREREQWLSADRARWTHELADGGVAALLGTLMPSMRWEAPELVYRSGTGTAVTDVPLAGRGLRVYPSRFVTEPLVLDLPAERPVLVVRGSAELADGLALCGLADLLGNTRARVLATLTEPASTSQLARRLAISAASASEHARVLRGSGLVATQRTAQSVLHSLTPLGRQLLLQSGATTCPSG